MPRPLWLVVASLLAWLIPSRPAVACAPAPRLGEAVRIADEEALIAWDSNKKVETFIRRASFKSSAEAFGFLVPTPTKPELGEEDARIFYTLSEHLRPRVMYEEGGTSFDVGCLALSVLGRAAPETSAGAAPAVRVLDEKRVAGFDAVVLSADDPAALSAWLKEKGFAEGPALTEWLAPYVAAKWIVTAFKVAEPAGAPKEATGSKAIATSAVKMTFATDRPFYPYREPRDQRETLQASHQSLSVEKRLLRVYFASDEKYEGALGDGTEFAATIKLADWVMAREWEGREEKLLGKRYFLTVFDDTSNPRPGTDDVFFSVAKNPVAVTIPPEIVWAPRHILIPIDGLILVGGLAAGIFFLVRRALRKA